MKNLAPGTLVCDDIAVTCSFSSGFANAFQSKVFWMGGGGSPLPSKTLILLCPTSITSGRGQLRFFREFYILGSFCSFKTCQVKDLAMAMCPAFSSWPFLSLFATGSCVVMGIKRFFLSMRVQFFTKADTTSEIIEEHLAFQDPEVPNIRQFSSHFSSFFIAHGAFPGALNTWLFHLVLRDANFF